jgi:hypothetical protein
VVAQDQVDHQVHQALLELQVHPDQVVALDLQDQVVHPVLVDHRVRVDQLDQVAHQVLVMMVLIQVDGILTQVLWHQVIQRLINLVLILQL